MINYKTFSQEKKDEVLAIARMHREQDRFIQGSWLKEKEGDLFKGCFFGCMTQSEDNTLQKAHETLEISLWLVHVSERIFEGLPAEQSVEFPVQLIEAIPVNSDSERIWKRFNYLLLIDQLRFTKKDSEQYNAVLQCANLFLLDEITESAAWSAAESAWSAAESARSARSAAESARSAAESAWSARSARSARSAAESAWSAARSARSAAESARSAAESAWSAARSAAESAWSAAESARSSYYVFMRDLLIKCLAETQTQTQTQTK